MANAGDMVVNFLGNAKHLEQTARGVQGTLGNVVSFAKRAAIGIGAAFTFREGLAAIETQVISERKLEAVLKATGGAAGLAADEIKNLASERQSLTNFGDQATIAASAMLATFKEIKGDIFKEAIVAAQDLSSVMEQDLKSSVVQLGKALNDPIKGVTALRRVGVSFTQQQLEQIKVMQQSGDILGAQKIILKELQSEFGGAAEAMATDSQQIKNTLGDILEEIFRPLLALMKQLNNVMQFFGANTKQTAKVVASFVLGLGLYKAGLIAVKLWQERVAITGSVMQAILTGGASVMVNAAAIAAATAVTLGALTLAEMALGEEADAAAAAGVNNAESMEEEAEAASKLAQELDHVKEARKALAKENETFRDIMIDLRKREIEATQGAEARRRFELEQTFGQGSSDVDAILKEEIRVKGLEEERKKITEEQKAIEDERLRSLEKQADEMERIKNEAAELAKTPIDKLQEKLTEFAQGGVTGEAFDNAAVALAKQTGLFDEESMKKQRLDELNKLLADKKNLLDYKVKNKFITPKDARAELLFNEEEVASAIREEGLLSSAPIVQQSENTAISGMDAISAVNQFNRDMERQQQEAAERRKADEKARMQREKVIKVLEANGVSAEKLNDKLSIAGAVT